MLSPLGMQEHSIVLVQTNSNHIFSYEKSKCQRKTREDKAGKRRQRKAREEQEGLD
jgi:hypothetical protein